MVNYTNLKNKYYDKISELINNLGKPVTLYFKSTITNVNSEFNDPIHDRSLRKPSYKSTSTNNSPTEVENTSSITALIQYNPSDFQDFGINVNKNRGVVRLKSFLETLDDIKRCDYMIPNSDLSGVYSKYRLIREPQPQGLGESKFIISYWERI
ncbi:MAG: hypothetical protein BAJALOKI3v1_50134 [Promethearchaeota archaeon]|nr:MAG: hypothetical protein BAJALOKI3v1_50134 [Candidatus Lokiarchaeota archaeon]